ncbi:hypothetical protein [Collimonas fungivorans]|jgi:hypothetical protein|nr:hypothetical protein [Collimonas fungivorans]
MEHLVIYFRHGMRDIIPYSEFISKYRISMVECGIGEYLGDDMAIDGGDAEGIFAGPSSKELFAFIKQDLCALSFMKGAKVTLVFGELEEDNPKEEFFI